MEQTASVSVLGTRGSSPVSGKDFCEYGGETSCFLVRMGSKTLVLDAGTGLLHLGEYLEPGEKDLAFFLSHAHLDHLSGLPVCPILFDSSYTISIFGAARQGLSVREQVERLLSPPLWPVDVSRFRAKVSFFNLKERRFDLDEIHVDTMEGFHPGGCTVFRFSYEEKSIVYATDYELTATSADQLCTFAQGCSLLLCDAQYTEGEITRYQGYGHSSQQAGAELGERCGAGHTLLIHHAPSHQDVELAKMERTLQQEYPRCSFAKIGKVVSL